MSPTKDCPDPAPRLQALLSRLAIGLGEEIRDARIRRGWTLDDLAGRSGVSRTTVHRVENGGASSLEGYCRIALPLGLDPEFTLLRGRRSGPVHDVDAVHAGMGEAEARQIGRHGPEIHLDEPYQHYQFAGRADLVAIDRARRAMLHIENRTRFPDLQGFAGSFNQKRTYLGRQLAERFGVRGGFASETHVVAGLWSSEVLHTVRLRTASFRAIAPGSMDAFACWWNGTPPPAGLHAAFVLFDPLPGIRATRRRFVGLDDVLRAGPRYRDYRAAFTAMRAAGLA